MERSNKPETRNPLLKLPGLERLQTLSVENRRALQDVLKALRADAQVQAALCWKRHKAPMALYWKCVAVYSGHIARLLRDTPEIILRDGPFYIEARRNGIIVDYLVKGPDITGQQEFAVLADAMRRVRELNKADDERWKI